MIAAGYSMELYCRNEKVEHPFNYFPHSFYGETWSECKKNAQAKGWIFHRDREVTCPICANRNAK